MTCGWNAVTNGYVASMYVEGLVCDSTVCAAF